MSDFPASEYEARIAAVQRLMAAADLPVILLASEAEIRYFTGFRPCSGKARHVRGL